MKSASLKKQKNSPIQRISPPSEITLTLDQMVSLVKPGMRVKTGELVGRSLKEELLQRRLHSPLTGEVVSVQSSFITISGEWLESKKKETPCSSEKITAKDIIIAVCENGLVGMGGSRFPTYLKLNHQKPIDYVLINGCESEPYLTCDRRILTEYYEEVQCGMKLAMKAVGAKQGFIITNKKNYISGYEHFLIEETLGRRVPRNKRPIDIGVIVLNVQTARALHRAICENRPLVERVITVDGLGVSLPGNYEVPIGTKFSHILERCGVNRKIPLEIIAGGPMMGQKADFETTLNAGIGGVLALSEKEISSPKDNPCIRCGDCIKVCPFQLPVVRLTLNPSEAVLQCIECGLCQFVCPAERLLVPQLKKAKTFVLRGKR